MNRHLSQIEKGRWSVFLKGPSSQHYASASIFWGTKAGAFFEIEKGRQLAEALKMSNQDLSAAPIFKRRFKQKTAFTEEFKKGADSRTLVVWVQLINLGFDSNFSRPSDFATRGP